MSKACCEQDLVDVPAQRLRRLRPADAGAGQIAVYLREAQAYMLISMPTCTSTIFGVFQVIGASHCCWRGAHAHTERRAGPGAAQVWNTNTKLERG